MTRKTHIFFGVPAEKVEKQGGVDKALGIPLMDKKMGLNVWECFYNTHGCSIREVTKLRVLSLVSQHNFG